MAAVRSAIHLSPLFSFPEPPLHEDWREDYDTVDLGAEMRRAGLVIDENGPALTRTPGARPNIMATRPA